MSAPLIGPQRVTRILNEMLATDRGALLLMLDHKVLVSEAVAAHPEIPTITIADRACVTPFAVINGLFGASPDGHGYVGILSDHAGPVRFVALDGHGGIL